MMTRSEIAQKAVAFCAYRASKAVMNHHAHNELNFDHPAPPAHNLETATMTTMNPIASALALIRPNRSVADDIAAQAIAEGPKGSVPAPKARRAKASDVRGSDPSPELAAMTANAIGHPPLNVAKPARKPKAPVKAKKPAPSKKGATKAAKAKKAASAPKSEKASKSEAPKVGRKAEVIGMMKAAAGTTVEKICAKTGMLPHSARALISGIGKTEKVQTSKESGKPTVYRIK